MFPAIPNPTTAKSAARFDTKDMFRRSASSITPPA
jgi:formate dehydrogenase iron-sulfur subunit